MLDNVLEQHCQSQSFFVLLKETSTQSIQWTVRFNDSFPGWIEVARTCAVARIPFTFQNTLACCGPHVHAVTLLNSFLSRFRTVDDESTYPDNSSYPNMTCLREVILEFQYSFLPLFSLRITSFSCWWSRFKSVSCSADTLKYQVSWKYPNNTLYFILETVLMKNSNAERIPKGTLFM